VRRRLLRRDAVVAEGEEIPALWIAPGASAARTTTRSPPLPLLATRARRRDLQQPGSDAPAVRLATGALALGPSGSPYGGHASAASESRPERELGDRGELLLAIARTATLKSASTTGGEPVNGASEASAAVRPSSG
jgi:hypothetical protein